MTLTNQKRSSSEIAMLTRTETCNTCRHCDDRLCRKIMQLLPASGWCIGYEFFRHATRQRKTKHSSARPSNSFTQPR